MLVSQKKNAGNFKWATNYRIPGLKGPEMLLCKFPSQCCLGLKTVRKISRILSMIQNWERDDITHIIGSSEDPVQAKQCLFILGWLQLTYRVEARVEGHTAGWTRTGAGQLLLTEQRYLESSLRHWNKCISFSWLPHPSFQPWRT